MRDRGAQGVEWMAMTREEIYDKVKDTLVDALSVEPEEVTPTATLMGDLGAESIDFLDIVFRLEKAFGIKIPQDEMMPREVLSNPAYVTNKKLNAQGVAALQKAMPHADLTQFLKDPDIEKMSSVFTVETIVRFVEQKLNAK